MGKQTSRVIASGDLLAVDQLDLTNSDPLAVAIVDENGTQIVPMEGAASAVGDGTTTVTTAGTRVQLTAQSCSKVRIQAHESNTGTIVVGGSTTVAALSGRRGIALYATQSEIFWVNNLNLLYVDATVSGDKVNWYFEN